LSEANETVKIQDSSRITRILWVLVTTDGSKSDDCICATEFLQRTFARAVIFKLLTTSIKYLITPML